MKLRSFYVNILFYKIKFCGKIMFLIEQIVLNVCGLACITHKNNLLDSLFIDYCKFEC